MDKSEWEYRNFENCIEKTPRQKQLKTSNVVYFENTPWNVFGDHTSFLYNDVSMQHQVIEDDKKKA